MKKSKNQVRLETRAQKLEERRKEFYAQQKKNSGRFQIGNTASVGNEGGRPTKLTTDFIAAAKEVMSGDLKVIIHGDLDLLFLINEKLEPANRISEATFKKWKNDSMEHSPLASEFVALYKSALLKQRDNLFEKFQCSDQWQKYAWILERKFDEWNLRHKQETKHDPGQLTQIENVLKQLAGSPVPNAHGTIIQATSYSPAAGAFLPTGDQHSEGDSEVAVQG